MSAHETGRQPDEDDRNTPDAPDEDAGQETGRGGAEPPDTTDENGMPLENPSGG